MAARLAARRQIDPIARFMQDHDVALEQLASLSKATRTISEQGLTPDARRRVLRAMRFIDQEVSVHNKSEEEALFPVLERYIEGPTKLMRDDHKLLKREFRRLRHAATRLTQNSRSAKAASDFTETSRRVSQIFVNHIHKENHILFPLVQKFLTRDALREIARRLI